MSETPDATLRKVVVVEDDRATLDYIAGVAGSVVHTRVVATSQNKKDALRLIRQWHPDIVLCDLGLPDGSGIEIVKFAASLDIPCMVISILDDENTVLGAIEAGASGYLLKDQSPEKLQQAITDMLAGGSPVTPAIASYLLKQLNGAGPVGNDTAGESPLSKRETQVLDLAAQGYRSREVANMLSLSPHTVANHQRNAYRKLGVKNKSEAVAVAVKTGLIDL